MTEIASIVSQLATISTTIDAACKQLIAATTQPTEGVKVQASIDLQQLAEEVAGKIDLSDVAGEISLSDLASEISVSDIADEIDISDLRDRVAEQIGEDINTSDLQDEVVRQVCDEIDHDDIAERIDIDELATAVGNNMDMDEIAERIIDNMDGAAKDDLAAGMVLAIKESPETMREIVGALAAQPVFVNAIAEAMARLMVAGAGFSGVTRAPEPEPHGARDTFVPATDGPTAEQYDTLKS